MNFSNMENLELEEKMKVYPIKAPFGVATRRFIGIGFHPDLDPSGSMKEDKLKLGPGEYFPAQFPKFCRYKDNNDSLWDRQLRSAQFSACLGSRNAHILSERQFAKSILGPGYYEVNEDLYKRDDSNFKENVQFGTEKRFQTFRKDDQLPPGTYFRNCFKKPFGKKSFSDKSTFEFDGCKDRFKDTDNCWNLAPNRYKIIDPDDTEHIIKRFVSLKGPYNLFTGPRDETTIKNHFAPPIKQSPDKFYTYPNELDYLLHHSRKNRCGRFLKADRFTNRPTTRLMLMDISTCYKDPNDPGPAHYEVNDGGIRKLRETKYGFNNSKLEVRQPIIWTNFPGPGRYEVVDCKCSYLTKKPIMSWVFKSKTKRCSF